MELMRLEVEIRTPGEHGPLESTVDDHWFKLIFDTILMSLESTDPGEHGPLESTVDDHWLMIWQEQVSVVVMLSNFTEDNKEKCYQYWPIKGKVRVEGSISVRLLQEKKYAFYTLRKIKLEQKTTATSRLVCHFQFTMWSDSEIPYPSELVQFYRSVKRAQDACPSSPVLVHCSEGGGRTGTFIALDKLHRAGQRAGRVNVTKCLVEMCEQRMNMVENMEQYILLYHTLKESFHRNVYPIRKEKLSTILTEEMQKPDKENYLRKQFCELMCVRPVYDDLINETGYRNIQLNLMPTVLPDEEFRVTFPSGERRTRNDFYNTVFLSTITEYNGLIVAPYPADNTAEDLIRLMMRQKSRVLVTMHPLIELHSTVLWYPDKSSELSQYKIYREASGFLTSDIQRVTIRIESTKRSEVHRVHVYEILSWSTKNIIPRDTKLATTVIKEARQTREEEGGGPITVMSYDGASGCGVFIALYNAMEQLSMDGAVDLFSIVHDIHIRLPRMMSTMDEYEFCYQAIAELYTQ
ncbi:receptor-type tyrosine-protein phosphatase alpha-like [Ostrea edulis]|uniref:receptor-type tyrosine-protein phosphatase alpha-like n=1 Tax=Ostrea edulis TaxID=37623 RepID=UPI0024AEA09F|nr:receptor-type tyrosine-protein phosphatase alpha-like [Ostrea edulis]